MTDFTKLEIGTEVFSTQYGVGKIRHKSVSHSFCIQIEFTNNMFWYTADGKSDTKSPHPTLFLSIQHAIDYFQSIAFPKLEVDAPIWVSHDKLIWEKRHFAKWENGKAGCWIRGFTSWTTPNTSIWNYYSLTDPKKK